MNSQNDRFRFPTLPNPGGLMRCTKIVMPLIVVAVFTATPVFAKPNLYALANQCNSLHKENACNELVKIAIGDKDASTRRMAVTRLRDQSALARIVADSTEADVRGTAAGQLTDQNMLGRIATGEKDASVRKVVVAKLADQSLLEKVATADTDAGVRNVAVERLTNEALLTRIGADDSDGLVRSTAKAISARLVAVRERAIAANEKKEWDSALQPFAVANLQSFLQRYPHGAHAPLAQQIVDDEQVIRQIAASGPGARFVLPAAAIPEFISNSIGHNPDRGRTTIYLNGNNITAETLFGQARMQVGIADFTRPQATLGPPLLPCGDSSVFVFKGLIVNIEGNAADPIRLLYSTQYGVVYLGGQGKIFATRGGTPGDVIFQTPSQ